jgi:hypothetical protein
MRAGVVEVLQQGSPAMLELMSDPHANVGGHGHDHRHEHDHHSGTGLAARLRHLLRPHSQELVGQVDAVMEASADGMRTLWISLSVAGRHRAGSGRGRRGIRVGRAVRRHLAQRR